MSDLDFVREVYDASYARLVGQLTGVTGDPAEAEDVVMDAFAKAAHSPRAFVALDNQEAWLRTVALAVLPADAPADLEDRHPRPRPARAAPRRRRPGAPTGYGVTAVVDTDVPEPPPASPTTPIGDAARLIADEGSAPVELAVSGSGSTPTRSTGS